jgi:hypothetical protein
MGLFILDFLELTVERWINFSCLQIMTLKVRSEASLNVITKDIHPHLGTINGKHRKMSTGSWDSDLPFPSKYYFKNVDCGADNPTSYYKNYHETRKGRPRPSLDCSATDHHYFKNNTL